MISAGETIYVTIGFETDYEFPKKLTLQRVLEDNKLVEYNFSL